MSSPPIRRKITHLITSLQGGGTESFLWLMLKHAPPGLDQEVLYLKRDGVFGERIRALGVSVQPTSAPRLIGHLRRRRPDILHTCLFRAHQVGRVAGTLMGVPRIVSSQRSIDLWMSSWQRTLDTWTLTHCDKVLANSQAARECIQDRLNGKASPTLHVRMNGWDPALRPTRDRMELRRAHGWEKDWIVGGSMMRLHPEKGADLIPAFAETLLTRHPSLHLMIAGNGPLESDLKRLTHDGQSWSKRLHWLGWIESASSLLPALDFAWSLSREESYPQSLLEASCAGIPWMAPQVGGIPDLVQEGAIAQLYVPGSVASAVEAGEKLIGNLGRLYKEAQTGAASFQSRHDVGRVAQQFYQDLCSPE